MDEIKRINEYENNEQWGKAKKELDKLWNINRNNLEVTIYYGAFCWYVLDYWERIQTKGLCKNDFYNKLIEITNIGIKEFYNEPEFLWKFGYMAALFPYFFGDYFAWDKKGKEMIDRAYKLCSNDPIIKMLYFKYKSEEKYKIACLEVSKIINERIKGDGVMAQYFRQVFS